MQTSTERLGDLTCHVIDALPEGRSPRCAVVLCHGFGAPGTDLVPLAHELILAHPQLAESTQFVFPEAPLAPEEFAMFGGRAWWPLSVSQFLEAMEGGRLEELAALVPPGLSTASRLLQEAVGQLFKTRPGLEPSQLVLGGFSQGGMLATDVALQLPTSPAALVVMSGSLIAASAWRERACQRGPLRVLQSHGRQDRVLPFEAGRALHDLLTECGLETQFVEFHGDHTISRGMLENLGQLVTEIAQR